MIERNSNHPSNIDGRQAIEEKETEMTEIISKSIVADHQALFEVIEQVALNGEVSQ